MKLKRIVADVPSELHQKLKIYAAKNNTTIKELIIKSFANLVEDK